MRNGDIFRMLCCAFATYVPLTRSRTQDTSHYAEYLQVLRRLELMGRTSASARLALWLFALVLVVWTKGGMQI